MKHTSRRCLGSDVHRASVLVIRRDKIECSKHVEALAIPRKIIVHPSDALSNIDHAHKWAPVAAQWMVRAKLDQSRHYPIGCEAEAYTNIAGLLRGGGKSGGGGDRVERVARLLQRGDDP